MANTQKHVVVVGGGLAGLSAALEAVEAGANVTIFDGEANLGGNSAKASSGMNGCDTKVQQRMGIKDSFDRCYSDTMKAGDNHNDGDLVDLLVHDSRGAVEWLTEMGVNLDDVNLCGGHSVARTHWIPSPKEGKPLPVGFGIISTLKKRLESVAKAFEDRGYDQKITIANKSPVTSLEVDEKTGRVTGVNVQLASLPGEDTFVAADAVILTTGGFGNDHEVRSLLDEFAPEKSDYPTTNGGFARGEGVKMARRIGAKLIDMQYVQIHPTGFIDPKNPADRSKFLAAEALRGKGAILLNHEGRRFADELRRRDYVTSRIEKHCALDKEAGRPVAWLVMTENMVEDFGTPAFNFYWKIKGFFTKLDTLQDVKSHTHIDSETFLETLTDYNAAADGKTADPLQKTVFPKKFEPLNEGPWYFAKVTPSIHYTMGGLAIDTTTRVLKADDEEERPILGLFAAGEVTGGVHGANRLAGNSLLECVVFGRVAGKNAATLA